MLSYDPLKIRAFLRFLVDLEFFDAEHMVFADPSLMAKWLRSQGLGSFSYQKTRSIYPPLAQELQHEAFVSIAESLSIQQQIQNIALQLEREKIEAVIFKGAAFAHTLYAEPSSRVMSDIDLWVRADDISHIQNVLCDGLDYTIYDKDNRPLELQALAKGEIVFAHQTASMVPVDVHWSPFPGWWLRYAASLDEEIIWQRKRPFIDNKTIFCLSPIDTILQLATHVAVNHQFSQSVIRALLEIVMVINRSQVSVNQLVESAQKFRLNTVLWCVLYLTDQLVGLEDEYRAHLQVIAPSRFYRKALIKFLDIDTVLVSHDLQRGKERFLLLLLLTDRHTDRLALIRHALFPTKKWLQARYGRPVGVVYHLKHLLRTGDL
ncbi:MAG: nucleotidyltransferase family protein [Anaerolineales bacterium]|nr:nucleotidyltransferase family protein [Anaerolineales bacterium]